MKNIHVLPTDKPSRLQLFEGINEFEFELCSKDSFFNKGVHIYITNDEEIKDGEYGICLNLVREGFKSHQAVFKMDLEQRQAMEWLGGQKKAEVLKVVLTTDPDLIKDGVQAIPEYFLEWFIEKANDSGKAIDIIETKSHLDSNYFDNGKINYQIIIPKEEPCDNGNNDICCCIIKEEQKQETLEEASFRFYPEDEQWTDRHIFTLGAKWQQQQNKNLYSEQTVTEYAYYFESCYAKRPMQTPLTPSKWFEQFKKK